MMMNVNDNKYIEPMFFGNPDLLERNLHNDLNTLIKNVKLRQDQHLAIVQYNKNLITQQHQLDSIAFLQEQILKHKIFLESALEANSQIKAEQAEMIQKYSFVASPEPSIIKLMGRVTARVMQICQASVDKIKYFDQSILQKQYQMKSLMMKILNEKQKIDIHLLMETVILYCQEKSEEELKKLKQALKILQEGDIPKLNQLYAPKPQLKKSVEKKVLKKSVQKGNERLQKLKDDYRNAEKTKKKKNKIANKMLNGLYSTMELSKQQFMEDMVFVNPEEKKKKLYEEIFSRNKFNHEQIRYFEAQKSEFEEKVKFFKERMLKQSQKIQQALVVKRESHVKSCSYQEPKSPKKKPNPEIMVIKKKTQTKSQPDSEPQIQIVIPEKEKMFRRRDVKMPSKAPSPRLNKEIVYSSMQSTMDGFQHIKFDPKNEEIFSRSNRAKLPQIPGRCSLDSKYENRSLQKDDKRVNIAKNIDIGAISSFGGKEEKKSPPKKKEKEQNEGHHGMEYTFYVRKKTNKFYETKNNFLF